MEKDDTDDISKRDWLNHEYTQEWGQKVAKDAAGYLRNVYAACERSTDPDVRATYFKWREMAAFSVCLQKGFGKS
jgi:hypothetical protein